MTIQSPIWNAHQRLEYCDAMEYLYEEWGNFPCFIPGGGPAREISRKYFKNWRFVLTPEGEIVFGNCFIPGITRAAFLEFKAVMEPEGM